MVGAVLLGSCANNPPSAAPRSARSPGEVVLFGDSLAWEARGYFSSLVRAQGGDAWTYTSRGSAVCDWLPTMRRVEARLRPKTVELEFSGNAISPCMRGDEPPSGAYFARYRADTLAAIALFVRGDGHVFLIGSPINRGDTSVPNWDQLNHQYASIAAADPSRVTYVDAGASVEGPAGSFAETLPCLPLEACTGPDVNGIPSNVVRAPDGGHFCPVEKDPELGVIGPCPVYSSGAHRYANAMVSALSAPRS